MTVNINHLGPCYEARTWLLTQPDPQTAYAACHRGDWLLWYASRVGCPRPLLVLAACDCARTALPYVPNGDARPLGAIEAAERWANDPTEENLKLVRMAADAAYDAAYATAAAAAYAAAYAASYAYAASADRTQAHAKCADLVRARIPFEVLK